MISSFSHFASLQHSHIKDWSKESYLLSNSFSFLTCSFLCSLWFSTLSDYCTYWHFLAISEGTCLASIYSRYQEHSAEMNCFQQEKPQQMKAKQLKKSHLWPQECKHFLNYSNFKDLYRLTAFIGITRAGHVNSITKCLVYWCLNGKNYKHQ